MSHPQNLMSLRSFSPPRKLNRVVIEAYCGQILHQHHYPIEHDQQTLNDPIERCFSSVPRVIVTSRYLIKMNDI
jgi:hypothetical protein